jgi:flagellar motor component MotA
MSEHHDTVKNLLDIVAVFTTFGAFVDMLSPWFGLIGAIVGVMRIVEMATGKPFSEAFRRKKKDDDAKQE